MLLGEIKLKKPRVSNSVTSQKVTQNWSVAYILDF
jgi:hypothetical protein